MVQVISNSQVKLINKLKQKKSRDELKLFLVDGVKSVSEVGKSNWEIEFIVFDPKTVNIQNLGLNKTQHFCINNNDIKKIKTVQTWPGITAVVKQKMFRLSNFYNNELVAAFENVADPGNLGTIIRTCDWFGIRNVLLSETSVDMYNEKVVRSSMGSICHIVVVQSTNFVDDLKTLKSEGYRINALILDGENITSQQLSSDKTVYLFGNESFGLSEEILKLADKKYEIQGHGSAESLNLAISVGIVLEKVCNKII